MFERTLIALFLAVAAVVVGCGDDDERAGSTPTVRQEPAETLAIGITEANPHLIEPGPRPQPFDSWRDRLVALEPRYVRVLVDWSKLQPTNQAPNFALETSGCMREVAPCAPYGGLRATLRAVARLGAEPVLVIYGTPRWAASKREGCERPGTTSYQRMPVIAAYRAFVDALLALTRELKLGTVSWSAWNEPNTPGFLNPQRRRCGLSRSRPVAPGLYVRLVRAMASVLHGERGQRMLLGDAAGVPERRPKAIGSAELIGELPRDLVCGTAAWAQHAHLVRPRGGGKRIDKVATRTTDELLTSVEQALDAHRCAKPVPIWITETGVGDARRGCTIVGRRLDRWRQGGRVEVAIQYSFREDPVFPVGLADATLTKLYPAYRAWRARGEAGC